MNEIVWLLPLIIGVTLFFVLRELFCWYFKINERLRVQKLLLQTMLKLYEKEGGEVDWEEVRKTVKF
jgi:hypothetical protein